MQKVYGSMGCGHSRAEGAAMEGKIHRIYCGSIPPVEWKLARAVKMSGVHVGGEEVLETRAEYQGSFLPLPG